MAKRTTRKQSESLPALAPRDVYEGHWSDYRCSRCGNGNLTDKKTNIELYEDPESKELRNGEGWEPDFIHGTFVGSLTCNNPNCGALTHVTGVYKVKEMMIDTYDGNYEQGFSEALRPTFFVPHVSLFPIPPDTPQSITDPLISAFEMYFANTGACANFVRQVVERFLDHLKITKYSIKNGRRKLRSTHERIEKLEDKNKQVADLLMAIKWVGNEGSHTGQVEEDDLDIGLRMIAKVLHSEFDNSDRLLEKHRKEITKRKGKKRASKQKRK